jgi:hypothetical protein
MPPLVIAMLGISLLLAVAPLAWAAHDTNARRTEEEPAAGEPASMPEAA